jgi:hypothetical protein
MGEMNIASGSSICAFSKWTVKRPFHAHESGRKTLFKGRILWSRFTQFLPKRLDAALRPKTTYPGNRWAGVLALSNVAREKPDARIPAFFLECMQDSNVAVRKIAAYEAGPWLDPRASRNCGQDFRLALADKSPQVRRDAFRRIAASKTYGNYVNALRELLPKLREMNVDLTLKHPERWRQSRNKEFWEVGLVSRVRNVAQFLLSLVERYEDCKELPDCDTAALISATRVPGYRTR